MFSDLIVKAGESIASAKAAVSNLEREEQMLGLIKDNWPSGVAEPTKYIVLKDYVMLTLVVDDENEAMVNIENLNPENLHLIRDGWNRIVPTSLFDFSKFPEMDSQTFHSSTSVKGSTPIHPFFYNIESNGVLGGHSVNCFKMVGDILCKLSIQLRCPNRQDYSTTCRTTGGGGGREVHYHGVRGICNTGVYNKHFLHGRADCSTINKVTFYYS